MPIQLYRRTCQKCDAIDKMRLSTVLCLLVLNGILLSQQMSACEGLKIAAFNIRQLGVKKIDDANFTTLLTNVCMCV